MPVLDFLPLRYGDPVIGPQGTPQSRLTYEDNEEEDGQGVQGVDDEGRAIVCYFYGRRRLILFS